MEYTVQARWDEEANVWIATSDEIPGLVLESEDRNELMERVCMAVPELMKMNGMRGTMG